MVNSEYSSYIVELSVKTVETDFDDKMPLRQMLPCSDSLCRSDISSLAIMLEQAGMNSEFGD